MNPDDLPTTDPFPGEADVQSVIESGVQKIMASARETAEVPKELFAGPGLAMSGGTLQADQTGGGPADGVGEYMVVFKNRRLVKKRVLASGADIPVTPST